MTMSSLSDDILIDVFLLLDAGELLQRCSLVCFKWYSILSEGRFWISKCHYLGYHMVTKYPFDYKKMCVWKPLNRNFITDHWDQHGRFHWDPRWDIEGDFTEQFPPVFLHSDRAINHDKYPVLGCLATSYNWAIKSIWIDLSSKGIGPEMLDTSQLTIVVSELIANRTDCGAIYEMDCFLADDNQEELPQCHFYKRVSIDQWAEEKWRLVEHSFTNYPAGVRYIALQCRSKDSQYWSGEFGVKMANCSVMVKLAD